LNEPEQIAKRRILVLPKAQVGEKELEEIVKIGVSGMNAKLVQRINTATI
jgi:pre-mRNA-splicing factor CDC5/CEF1